MPNMMGIISANYSDSMGELTAQRSVAALPFGGRYRLIDFTLSNMVNAGIRTVAIITPHKYRAIMDHLGAGKDWGLDRKIGGLFILPGAVYGLKSEAGRFLVRDFISNRISLARAKSEMVLITDSSCVYNCDFKKIGVEHMKSGCEVTMLYKKKAHNDGQKGTYLEVNGDGRVTAMVDEPQGKSINYFMNACIINRDLLLQILGWYEMMPHMDLMDVIAENLDKVSVSAHQFKGYFDTIDNVSDYVRCSMDLLNTTIRDELFTGDNAIKTKTQDNVPTKYFGGAQVVNSLIPSGCEIRGRVENSVLFRGAKVGEGAVIKNSIVFQRSVVEAGAVLEHVICDKSSTITEGTRLYCCPEKPGVIAKGEIF